MEINSKSVEEKRAKKEAHKIRYEKQQKDYRDNHLEYFKKQSEKNFNNKVLQKINTTFPITAFDENCKIITNQGHYLTLQHSVHWHLIAN